MTPVPQTQRQPRLMVILLMGVVIALSGVYQVTNLTAASSRDPVMPLDDTYIHFQYARAFAEGHPMRYNPGDPPTSGATSLIYPILLAIGYVLGFKAAALGWWALAIGLACWIGSAWLVFDISRRAASNRIALVTALAFACTGSLGWAFMSGMETGLIILSILLVLWYVVQGDLHHTMLAGALAALVRPEGLFVAGLAVVYFVLREAYNPHPLSPPLYSVERGRLRHWLPHLPFYVLPVIAGAVQPLVNWIATGSMTASGLVAKSYLYNVPSDADLIWGYIWANFVRGVGELLSGFNGDDGMYYLFLLPLLALIGIAVPLVRWMGERREKRSGQAVHEPPLREGSHVPVGQIGIMVVGWIVAILVAVSLLETAFWQFKRYQQPIVALLFPLAAWGLNVWPVQRFRREVVALLSLALLGSSLYTSAIFLGYYADNVYEVAFSQIKMAQWVDEHLRSEVVVAVHDIGVMRYLGNRNTYDLVGLTTPGVARAWRNGPGAVYEQLAQTGRKVAYFATYPDARGLTYFAETSLFKNPLATFPSTKPKRNVASATSSGQAVYHVAALDSSDKLVKQPSTMTEMAAFHSRPIKVALVFVDQINVGDVVAEDNHAYRWWNAARPSSFATELHELQYYECRYTDPSCTILDGGRLITGGEEMTITTQPGMDLLWITRVHPHNTATLGIFVDGKRIATRYIPYIPGRWFEIATLIPGSEIKAERTRLRVEANITDPAAGAYMPYHHWFYQGQYNVLIDPTLPTAAPIFADSIELPKSDIMYYPSNKWISVRLTWRLKAGSTPPPDAKIFVHLYSDPQQPPVAQIDARPGQNTLPPANWLPGLLEDTFWLDVPSTLAPGTYRIAVGLYDPITLDRFPVSGAGSDANRRLFIGEVTIK